MTPTARKALMLGLGYGLLAINHGYAADDSPTAPHKSNPSIRKSQLTPKQKKARNKAKQARKARRK